MAGGGVEITGVAGVWELIAGDSAGAGCRGLSGQGRNGFGFF
jgi:hypothetical protein